MPSLTLSCNCNIELQREGLKVEAGQNANFFRSLWSCVDRTGTILVLNVGLNLR